MPEPDDSQLLAQFAREKSEPAFAELVRRHVNLVYSAARRHTGNDAAAEEITQAVFIILARKAGALSPRTVLPGWLWRTARLTAANHQRAEARRLRREQEAYMQSTMSQSEAEAWPHIAPLLDDALDRLGRHDRDALVLRFFENKNLREVGLALGASEDAAKMRVNRALEKLRKFFSKRGVTLSAALIAGAVSANSVQAAPPALAGMISTAALAKGAAVSVTTMTLAKATLITMKIKTIVATVSIVAVILGVTWYLAESKSGGAARPVQIVLPIRLANADSKRDARDPLFVIGVDMDTRRTSNSAPAVHIQGPVTPPVDLPPGSSDAAQQKAGNSSSAPYLVAKGSPLLGRRILITGWLKTSGVKNWAAPYMCIWSKDHGFVRLDTLDDRPVHGTTDWQQIEMVTDVPDEPCYIYTGPDLYGPGEVWGDDFQIDLAPPDASITDDRSWRLTSQSPNTYTETDDYASAHDGHRTVRIAYVSDSPGRNAWAWWGRKIRAPDFDKYRGHTMRMSGWVKLENVSGRLQPCVRPWDIRGHFGNDSMSGDYSLKGTLGWTHFSAAGAIAKDAGHIDTPFIFWGSGKVWIDMDSLTFEVIN